MKRVPKLRFPEFTDDWEQRKVSEVAEICTGGTPSTGIEKYWYPKEIPWLSSGEVHKKYITYTDNKISVEGMNNSSARMIPENSVLIALAGQGKTRGTVAINRISLTTNQSIAAMTFSNEIVPEFVFCNLENRYEEIRRMSSGDGSRGGLNKQIVGEIEIPYTSKEEQTKMGAYFSTLDHLITLHQRKLEKLKELRKGVMKKLFSQEVRFKADDGSEFPDWEEKKLGDDVQFINGRAYKQDELLNSGKYLVLRVGNLFTNDSYYYSDLELDNDKYIENGDLIYAWSATFGPRIYYGEKCIYHYHIWKLKFDENIISKIFLNYYLLYDVEKIKSQRTGGTMVHITKNAMEHRELQFPCLAEQQKIADCLSTLDDVIEKQKETLAAWEELKKGLLQQMFV